LPTQDHDLAAVACGVDQLTRPLARRRERGLELSDATAANLQALGVRVPVR